MSSQPYVGVTAKKRIGAKVRARPRLSPRLIGIGAVQFEPGLLCRRVSHGLGWPANTMFFTTAFVASNVYPASRQRYSPSAQAQKSAPFRSHAATIGKQDYR